MIMKDVAFLAGAVPRSQAYLQAMVKAGMHPGKCILYGEKNEDFSRVRPSEESESSFYDTSESLVKTLDDNCIPYDIILDRDINSPEMKQYLQKTPQNYMIYSGYGGCILKPHLFGIGKYFLHVHAGLLPHYRGSTTAYYSLLLEGCIGASAIFLSENIDEGDMITVRKFRIPKNPVNIDYVYEPWVRSQVLVDALSQYIDRGCFQRQEQEVKDSEIYYIIHPVLKHIALLKVEKMQEAEVEDSHIFTASRS